MKLRKVADGVRVLERELLEPEKITDKQLKCASTDEWINQMKYIHTIEYVSLEKKGNSDTCYNMDEPGRYMK